MKSKEDLISRVKYKLEVTEKDGTVVGYQPSRKSKITRSGVLKKMESAYLRVSYRPGVSNEGTFVTADDLINCLKAWTEDIQLEYVYRGAWA